jgi:hypothetical protein
MKHTALKTELRERLRSAIEVQIEYLENDPELSSKERIEYITRLLPYVVGKISAAKVDEQDSVHDPIGALL